MDGIIVEDIIVNNDKRKRKNSSVKGKRGERLACKELIARFGQQFSRSLGSGNRTSQIHGMPDFAKKTFSGDICCPDGFRFVIEHKFGYEEDVDLHNSFFGGCKKLDEFLEQVTKDANYCKRKPLLLWKRARKPYLSFIKISDIKEFIDSFKYKLLYRDWVCISLKELLALDNDFFYESGVKASLS